MAYFYAGWAFIFSLYSKKKNVMMGSFYADLYNKMCITKEVVQNNQTVLYCTRAFALPCLVPLNPWLH